MTPSHTIVFDLDGTLVDTAPDLITALNYVLDREGLPPVPMASARNMIGAGARKLIERGLEAEGRSVTVADMDRMTADFIAYYADNIAVESRPFEGLEAALDHFAAQGHRLAVCTNKLEWLSKRLLDQLDLSRRFAAICGADTFGVQKPDPTIFRETVGAGRRRGQSQHHGRRRRTRCRRGPARRSSRHRGELRLYGRADRRAEAGPADPSHARPAGRRQQPDDCARRSQVIDIAWLFRGIPR
ncbi:2-phosphoglycolate phosphatase [Bradyrhizobium sp. F1.13.4]